jgi:hypothetical protein
VTGIRKMVGPELLQQSLTASLNESKRPDKDVV